MLPAKTVALITGATSGIGLELARIHARHRGDLILVARRQEKLDEIKNQLETEFKVSVHVISLDLAEPQAALKLFNEIAARNFQVHFLINNAGVGGLCSFEDQDSKLQSKMMNLNMVAPTELMRLFIPVFKAQGFGKILNVSSMAGFIAGPYHAIYYATKAYLKSLSEAVRYELRETEITVTTLCPGPTQSDFFESAGVHHKSQKYLPTSSTVAECGYRQMLSGRAWAVPGFGNKFGILMMRFLPTRILTGLSARRLRNFF